MKFDTLAGGDAINAYSFNVEIGFTAPGDEQRDSIKFITKMDGSIEVLNYGSRKEQISQFKIINMTNTEFVALMDFIQANIGKKINIEQENTGETIFTDAWSPTDYYCYLLEGSGPQEEDFSAPGTCDELYTVTLRLSLSGELSTDEINSDNSSLIDVLIEVDTVQTWLTSSMDYMQDTQPVGGSEGEYWFDTDDYKLYKYLSSVWTEQTPADQSRLLITNDRTNWEYRSSSADWELLRTLPANDATLGWKNGQFNWSAFSNLDTAVSVEHDYVAGVINHKTIRFPTESIDINRGPNIAHKTGFKFSIDNSDKFWNFITSNGISLFGAKVTMRLYYKDSVGTVTNTVMRTGINRTNTFSYTDYSFEVEPFLLNKIGKFPPNTIEVSDARYTNVIRNSIGKAPYITYGQWTDDTPAALQNISFEPVTLAVTRTYNGVTTEGQTIVLARIDTASSPDYDKILINKDAFADTVEAQYVFDSDQISALNQENYVVYIITDTQDPTSNEDQSRVISNIDDDVENPGYYTLTITESFPTAPGVGDTIIIQVISKTYQFQADDGGSDHTIPSGGFGEPEDATTDVKRIQLQKLDETGRELIFIPSTDFTENTEKNKVSLSPRTAIDTEEIVTYTSTDNLKPAPIDPHVTISFDNTVVYDGTTYGPMLSSINPVAGTESLELFQHEYTGGYYGRGDSVYDATKPWYLDRWYGMNWFWSYPDHTVVRRLTWPVNHANDSTFVNQTEVRLGIHLRIQNMLMIGSAPNPNYWQTPASLDPALKKKNWKKWPAGLKIVLRFKTTAGTYITDNNWEYDFADEELGAQSSANNNSDMLVNGWNNQAGNLTINNLPDGDVDNGGFRQTTTTLKTNFDYIIRAIGSKESLSDYATRNDHLQDGSLVWINEENSAQAGYLAKIRYTQTFNGSTWDPGFEIIGGTFPSVGDKLMLLNDVQGSFAVYEVTAGTPLTLTALDDGVDYDSEPVYRGRDIFDISKMFGASPTWSEVTDMELLILTKDYSQVDDFYIDIAKTTTLPWGFIANMVTRITQKAAPQIFYLDTVNVVDQPSFSAFKGRTLASCGNYQSPECIIRDVLDNSTMYEGQYNLSSLQQVLGYSTRSSWKWRKQFTKSMPAEKVLKEILDNLWACAIIDDDDTLAFKSLIPKDHGVGSPIITYGEATIVKDSITNPKFRRSEEIFQNFELAFNYFPPSEFSSALLSHNGEDNIDENSSRVELARLCKTSRILYNVFNTYKKEFNYHYEGEIVPFSEYVVKHLVLNAWSLRFRLPLSISLTGGGPEMMDYVAIKTTHHTNNEVLEGFINYRSRNVYDGYTEYGLFIIKPPGQFGGICDPFNDALNTARDISGWTDANGKRNSAGSTGRSIGGYTQKDAGSSPRTLSC